MTGMSTSEAAPSYGRSAATAVGDDTGAAVSSAAIITSTNGSPATVATVLHATGKKKMKIGSLWGVVRKFTPTIYWKSVYVLWRC